MGSRDQRIKGSIGQGIEVGIIFNDMVQFLETICIKNRLPQHLKWHQRRVDATLRHFYPHHPHTWHLEECIKLPDTIQSEKIKCRIIYDAHHFEIHFEAYEARKIDSLKLIEASPDLDYRYKYADRHMLDELFVQRQNADDILMTREGWITDTSMANIAFETNGRWYTPLIPLLAGTTWKRLVSEGFIIPKPVHSEELPSFVSFKVFNALNPFDQAREIPIGNIR